MPAGRPRTTSLSHDEMISLGEEMIAYVLVNKPMHLSKFYSFEKKYLYSEWKAMKKIPEFVPYYEQAMQIIGEQYLDKNSIIREGASQRWQRVYFKDLKEEEDEKEDRKLEKEFEYKKKLLELEQELNSEKKPPLIDQVNIENENMLLKAEIQSLKDLINDKQSKTE